MLRMVCAVCGQPGCPAGQVVVKRLLLELEGGGKVMNGGVLGGSDGVPGTPSSDFVECT